MAVIRHWLPVASDADVIGRLRSAIRPLKLQQSWYTFIQYRRPAGEAQDRIVGVGHQQAIG